MWTLCLALDPGSLRRVLELLSNPSSFALQHLTVLQSNQINLILLSKGTQFHYKSGRKHQLFSNSSVIRILKQTFYQKLNIIVQKRISTVMLLSERYHPLSQVYTETKQCFALRTSGKYWFAPLLTLAEQIEPSRLKSDIEKKEYHQLLKMFNFLVSDLIPFYKNLPEDAFNLLTLVKTVFSLGSKWEIFEGFQTIMSQVHLNCSLALLLFKNRQYAYVSECYDEIVEVIKTDKVDTGADIFLVSLSNYLTFLKTHQFSQSKEKFAELLELLKAIYRKLLTRYTSLGCQEESLLVILAVYKQQEPYLEREFKAQNQLLIKKYESINQIQEQLVHGDPNFRQRPYEKKNKKMKNAEIEVKRKQMYFFASSMLFLNKANSKGRYSVQLSNSNREQERGPHYRTIDLSESSIAEVQPSNLPKQEAMKTIDAPRYQSMELKPLKSVKVQFTSEKKIEKPARKRIMNINEPVSLKINYSILEIINDGIIVSDFLKERKKFITWQQIFVLLRHLRFCYIFSQILPICTFYDVGRILSFYVYRSINSNQQEGALILECPKEFLEINMLTKLYLVDGNYMKLFMMNQYNTEHIVLSVDCYIAEFTELFKCVTKNEYIQKLNKKIFNKDLENDQNVYSMELWKKRKETTAEELSNQIKTHLFEEIPFIKISPFRILILIQNNIQLILYLRQKDLKDMDGSALPMTVVNLQEQNESKRELKLNVPFYRLHRYFPIDLADVSSWMKKFGKIIFEGYVKCFKDFPDSFNNLQFFDLVTYAKKTQLAPMGKYLTPVTAELVGSATKIWGICIRFFEQSFVKETITFIFNPYPELLAPVIKQSPQERKNLLISQLFEGKVLATHKKLQEAKLTGTMVNLMTYWSLIDF